MRISRWVTVSLFVVAAVACRRDQPAPTAPVQAQVPAADPAYDDPTGITRVDPDVGDCPLEAERATIAVIPIEDGAALAFATPREDRDALRRQLERVADEHNAARGAPMGAPMDEPMGEPPGEPIEAPPGEPIEAPPGEAPPGAPPAGEPIEPPPATDAPVAGGDELMPPDHHASAGEDLHWVTMPAEVRVEERGDLIVIEFTTEDDPEALREELRQRADELNQACG